MRDLLLLTMLCFLNLSCTQKREKGYFLVQQDDHMYSLDTISLSDIQTSKYPDGSQQIIFFFDELQFQPDSIIYYFQQDTLYPSKRSWTTLGEDTLLRQVLDTTIYFQKDSFRVYQFLQEQKGFDDDMVYYWCPQVGMFAYHPYTWPSLAILQTPDQTLNHTIYRLVIGVVPQFYIRGGRKDGLAPVLQKVSKQYNLSFNKNRRRL
jgi:hypothetical protein